MDTSQICCLQFCWRTFFQSRKQEAKMVNNIFSGENTLRYFLTKRSFFLQSIEAYQNISSCQRSSHSNKKTDKLNIMTLFRLWRKRVQMHKQTESLCLTLSHFVTINVREIQNNYTLKKGNRTESFEVLKTKLGITLQVFLKNTVAVWLIIKSSRISSYSFLLCSYWCICCTLKKLKN